MFPGIKDLMKQAREAQEKILADLRRKETEVETGGGMVKVRVNGAQEILSLRIDPEMIKDGDAEVVQELVLAAVQEALRKSREMAQADIQNLANVVPGLGNLFKK